MGTERGRILTELRRSNASGTHIPSHVRSRENSSAIQESLDGWEVNMYAVGMGFSSGDPDLYLGDPDEYEPDEYDLLEIEREFGSDPYDGDYDWEDERYPFDDYPDDDEYDYEDDYNS